MSEYKYYSIGKRKIEKLLESTPKDNANIGYNTESFNKYILDDILKQYALDSMPVECKESYDEGLIHYHDLEYCMTRPNCFNLDIRFIARNGLKIDGIGDMGSVGSPAKSLEVLLNHLLQTWMACSICFSGGLGAGNFNTFLSPYACGRSYEEIKQAIQGFIFNCNMSLVGKSGQIIFSSIGMDLSCPEQLKDAPAVGVGGVEVGTYSDYLEEADLIFRAVCEVIDEKDATRNPHRYPNTIFHLRKGDLDSYEGNCRLLHELGANNPTIYYSNCMETEKTLMGCRTGLEATYTGDYDFDSLNTGNFMYTTLNLPLIGLKHPDDFFEELDKQCEISYNHLIWRRNHIEDMIYNKKISTLLLWKDEKTGRPFYQFENSSMAIGYCGINELVVNSGIDGEEVLKFLNKKANEFKERDGLRWSVFSSPAESTAFKFGMIVKEKYPDAIVQGKPGRWYLTNSHHIPVKKGNLIDHVKNADKYHKYSHAGAILHLWLGEVWSDPKSLWKFNQKILRTNTLFWAYSKVFTWCKTCNFTINDNLSECPICKSKDLLVYDRCTGYYLPVKTFNKGKAQEFKDRKRQELKE